MNLSYLYQEVSDIETHESADGHAQDPIQVGQTCSIFMRRVKAITGFDMHRMLEEYPDIMVGEEQTP